MERKAQTSRDPKGKGRAKPSTNGSEDEEGEEAGGFLSSPPPSAEEKPRVIAPPPASSSSAPRRGAGGGAGAGAGGGAGGVLCQADRCTADFTDAKRYHRRHKVCEAHSKAAVVVVSGIRQRFCQQCSRFHELSEFDDSKRSCRRRLAGHNERRRKSSSDPHQTGGTATGSDGSARCRQADPPDGGRRIPLDVSGNPPPNYKHFQIR